MSQDQIDRAGIYNAEDLSTQVAGLDFQGSTATGGRNNPSIRFRGMNQQIITPSTQIGALFWDGSYIGGGGAFLPFGDLERVEVIKGPQTAFFGRNTFSGAVNLIPKKPTDEWEGDIDLEWSPSQSDEYKIEGAVGGPLGDKAGVRVWVGYSRDDRIRDVPRAARRHDARATPPGKSDQLWCDLRDFGLWPGAQSAHPARRGQGLY